jgi:hypothetical protein
VPAFCVLLSKLRQQWAGLYCTDVEAGVKKDSGSYTFVHPAADCGEHCEAAVVKKEAPTGDRG